MSNSYHGILAETVKENWFDVENAYHPFYTIVETVESFLSRNTKYICTLPTVTQAVIMASLLNKGIDGEDLEKAMNSRACDIADALR